jgi:hypothetical protein
VQRVYKDIKSEGLAGKTPSEAYGIELKGENKWITLIQNASAKINRRVIEERSHLEG